MGTLYEKILEIEPQQWDYNYYCRPELRMNLPNFENDNYCDFIKKYFHRAGKEDIFKKYFSIEKTLLKRSSHTVSIFFLGILFYQKTKIWGNLRLGENPPGYEIFPFLWFLTCLFHDFGYDYEEDSKKHLESLINIDGIKREFNIEYDLLTQNIENILIPKDIFQCISNYFLFKREEYKKLDHGIVAGLYYYDKLVKNRRFKYEKLKERMYDKGSWGD
ncbi:MAG TPA: hypothetical protein PLP19_21760 [bacterium]|nr:hypothetical protein [bacterium]HPN46125.1 hypothetical protein [bacterium]